MTDRVILERDAWVPDNAPIEDQGPLHVKAIELPDGLYSYAMSDETAAGLLQQLIDLMAINNAKLDQLITLNGGVL